MKYLSAFFVAFAAALLSACSGNSSAVVPSESTASASLESLQGAQPPGLQFAHACGPVALGFVRCHALWAVVPNATTTTPAGYGPSSLRTAYGLTTASASYGSGQTVAIVDAYDDPKAASDLSVYRSKYGLPACTSSNGCFRKVNQSGGTSYPRGDRGWAEEISLDLDMVSAICPNCHILLVEATSTSLSNLAAAVDEAAKLGAKEISNSYGGGEFSTETSYQSHYNHPGIAITASSGDSGYGVEFPAASQYVTAVGGTTLTRSSTGTYSESAWSGAGSGCSAYIPQQTWQHNLQTTESTVCPTHRMVADVAADANPNTGVAVYDTYNQSGWLVFGGTSVASPIVASVYALAGNASSITYGSYPYSHRSYLRDITSGSNGTCGTFLCKGVSGYDGPTGVGTPKGTTAF